MLHRMFAGLYWLRKTELSNIPLTSHCALLTAGAAEGTEMGIALKQFIKICQNTLQLCWGDEWPTLSPGACLREAASAKAGERVRVRGK